MSGGVKLACIFHQRDGWDIERVTCLVIIIGVVRGIDEPSLLVLPCSLLLLEYLIHMLLKVQIDLSFNHLPFLVFTQRLIWNLGHLTCFLHPLCWIDLCRSILRFRRVRRGTLTENLGILGSRWLLIIPDTIDLVEISFFII